MRDHRIPSDLESLLCQFKVCFSRRAFENFVSLQIGWILSGGRRTISRVVDASGALSCRHFSSLYRFFSRAKWLPDEVARVLVSIVVARLGSDVEVSVDDTLCKRTGPHFFGAAMHHDGVASAQTGATGGKAAFAFGHNWVILAIRLPLPWAGSKSIAVPVMLRLYRSLSRCPEAEYRKRTELGREMVESLRAMLPREKRLFLVGDSEYACCTMLKDLPDGIYFAGPIHRRAALFAEAPDYSGHRRPRIFGEQEHSPEERFGRAGGRWRKLVVNVYGSDVELQVKTSVTRWRKVTGTRPVRLVLTRDPSGKYNDRSYFSTDLSATTEQILQRFAARWLIEVSFRDLKQHFGLGDAQNGWGKGRTRKRRAKRVPGPQPRGSKGRHAIERTAPFATYVYAILVLWYVDRPRCERNVEAARAAAPWYTEKTCPSVQDMLIALRGDLLARRLSRHPEDWRARLKTISAIPRALLAA